VEIEKKLRQIIFPGREAPAGQGKAKSAPAEKKPAPAKQAEAGEIKISEGE
jgi:hypothetical protein